MQVNLGIALFGICAGVLTHDIVVGDWIVMGLALIAAILALSVLYYKAHKTFSTLSDKVIAQAIDQGRGADASVLDFRRTALTLNESPVFEFDLVVVPTDRVPYRTTMQLAIHPI